MSGPESYGQRPKGAEGSSLSKDAAIRRKADKDGKLREVVERADKFSELKGHPVWAELYAELQRKQQRFADQVASQILNGIPVDMEYVRLQAARYAGARWILSHPEEAQKSLDAASKELFLRENDDMFQEE